MNKYFLLALVICCLVLPATGLYAQEPPQASPSGSLYEAPSERVAEVSRTKSRYVDALHLHLQRIERIFEDLYASGLEVKGMAGQIKRTKEQVSQTVMELEATTAKLEKQHVRFDKTISKLLDQRSKQVGGVVDRITNITNNLDAADEKLQSTEDEALPKLESELEEANKKKESDG